MAKTKKSGAYQQTFVGLLCSIKGDDVEVRLNNGKSLNGKLVFIGQDYIMLEYQDKQEIKLPAIPFMAIDYVI